VALCTMLLPQPFHPLNPRAAWSFDHLTLWPDHQCIPSNPPQLGAGQLRSII
jgi:hypothetical protein